LVPVPACYGGLNSLFPRRDVEPSYPAWKVDAVKALQRLNARTAFATPERLWTHIRRFSPAEAAELAEREYRSTRPPEWLKKG
jgi:hypothetical protein